MKINYYDQILMELNNTLSKLDDEPIKLLLDAIVGAKRIFLAGTGRSGLMMKCFAMRLMHLGLKAYVVGETTTPGISDNDLLIIGSGSGETGSVSTFARTAKKQKAKLGLITAFPDSAIGKLAEIKILVRVPSSENNLNNGFASIQHGGTLFEQSLMLVLDGMIVMLTEKLNVDPSVLRSNHANLE
jgi:6-phospho-3-hexuloisomerase